MTFVISDILKIEERVILEESHARVIDFLQAYYPTGFTKHCDLSVNEEILSVENYDRELKEDDVIVLLFRPGVTAAMVGGAFYAFVINLAISMAISYVIGQIFKPSLPSQQSTLGSRNSRGKASSVYSLNSQQNEAKRGEVIPIIYGKIRTYPALIAPPYYRYENNEEYLYQLMCIGQGKFGINQLLISDTDTVEIQTDYFKTEQLEYNDFSVSSNMISKINDSSYHSLVKTIPDVENLELRGTPQNNSMIMRFEGSTITFYPYSNGDIPDLSSLSEGSKITITDTVSNNGDYYVAANGVSGLVVTVSAHTFITEPDIVVDTPLSTNNIPGTALYYPTFELVDDTVYFITSFDNSTLEKDDLKIDSGVVFSIELIGDASTLQELSSVGKFYDGGFVIPGYYTLLSNSWNSTNYDKTTGTIRVKHLGKEYKASFETSYGSFNYNKSHIGFEIDYVYASGVYDTDTSGNFIDRLTEFEIYYNEGGVDISELISTTDRHNSPIRVSHKHLYTTPQSTANIRLKRITAEPTSINSSDKVHIKSIKFIHDEPDYSSIGDVTLLWAKVRASNAISSVGQFAINAWVTRNDVANDVNSVITDLYTNTTYGGRLPASELTLDSTPTDFVNGAIDSKMTLFDAMQMVAKSNRYSVFPSGTDIKLKYDGLKPIRSALFNETNMIKDSLKISYLFEEEDQTDSIKVLYRGASDFKEATALYPITGVYPESVELWGCTDSTVAEAMAKYLYKQDASRRKSIEFKTDIQGIIPQFLDRIAISHNVPSWGFGGQIASIDSTNPRQITISCDYDRIVVAPTFNCDEERECYDTYFPFCPTGTDLLDTIVFRNADGSVSSDYKFDIISKSVIQLTTDGPAWLYDGEDYDKTFFSIGSVTQSVKDYIVTSIKPNGDELTVQCVNYDEDIYI